MLMDATKPISQASESEAEKAEAKAGAGAGLKVHDPGNEVDPLDLGDDDAEVSEVSEVSKAVGTAEPTAEEPVAEQPAEEPAADADAVTATEPVAEATPQAVEVNQGEGAAEPSAEPEPEAEAEPVSPAVVDFMANIKKSREKIAELESVMTEAAEELSDAETNLESAKGQVKTARAQFEQARTKLMASYGDMMKAIDRGPESLPLFDRPKNYGTETAPAPSPLVDKQAAQPAADTSTVVSTTPETKATPVKEDESWRSITVEEIGLPTGICTALRKAKMHTLGPLADWTKAEKKLTDIDGIGKVKAELIIETLDKFWLKWGSKQDAAPAAEAVESAEATEQPAAEPKPEAEADAKPTKAKGKGKGVPMDASKADDFEKHLETCDEIQELIERAFERTDLGEDGESFLGSVAETLTDLRMDIAEKKRATPKQVVALDGMRDGVAKWIKD